ncbi:FG-GAP repeat domain-containing protein [Rhizocola hellebori]|uniref:FG-GAP repeat domain-containing protein n=1 Tax=Rhizocola hellebori TaxID=1392758 RepID=UPI001940987D|nr:VCBS repeat-containing protein [Rhizocola hellebori]
MPVDNLWACLVPSGFTYGYSETSASCPPSADGKNRMLLRVPVDRLWACLVPDGFTYDSSETSASCPAKVGGRNRVHLRVPADHLGACLVPTGFTFDSSENSGSCPPALNGRNFAYLRMPVDGLWACAVPAGFTFDSSSNSGSCPPAADGRNYFRLRGKPGPPTDLQATAGNGSASLTWRRPASAPSGSITSYTITASPGGATTTAPGTTTSATINNLTNGTTYTFTMTATNSYGTSMPSAPSNSVTPIAPTPPGAPSNVTAVAGYAAATVSWSTPPSNGSPITGYTVTSSPGGITTSTAASTATIGGLTSGTTYTFTVTATNAAGIGPVSAPSNPVIPLRPAGFDADNAFGTYAAGITWTKGGNHWADVNGDGQSDFVYLESGTANWHVALSTGSSLGPDTVWGTSNSPIKWDTGDGPRTADVNNDGRQDIIYYEAGTGATWHVLLSTTTGFATDTIWATTTDGISSYGGQHQFFLVDADGDHRTDIVYLKDGTLTWRAALSSAGTPTTLGPDQTYGTQTFATTATGGYHAHYWTDLNNDNRTDLTYLKAGTSTIQAGLSR